MMKKVIPIILFTVSAILLSACGRKEELYEIPDLSQYKTDYVGDSSNVINIVSGQEYPEGYSYDSILHVDLAPVKELVSLQRRCANNLN